MSAREWKPGDVALVTYFDPPQRAIVRPRRSDANQRLEFAYDGGGYDMVSDVHVAATARPLVVIDPEDAHQVGALADLFFQGKNFSLESQMAALRDFANPTPPKPDEPLGLGAVVEDADGTKWLRHDSVAIHRRWLNTDDCDTRFRAWDEIAAVKVLSAGVQS